MKKQQSEKEYWTNRLQQAVKREIETEKNAANLLCCELNQSLCLLNLIRLQRIKEGKDTVKVDQDLANVESQIDFIATLYDMLTHPGETNG